MPLINYYYIMNIKYEEIKLEWTKIPKVCNTNNHKIEDMEQHNEKLRNISQEEYIRILDSTNKNVWIKYFPEPLDTILIPLPISMCRILKEASIIGYLSGNRPKIIEELDNIENYIDTFLTNNNDSKYFVRINRSSPKDGNLGPGPLKSAKEIVLSLTTSLRIHKALTKIIEEPDILYLVKWRDDWQESLEFRVFVNKKKVTCFSQYNWSNDLGWTNETISLVAPSILDFCTKNVIQVFPLDSYVVDIIIVLDQSIGKSSKIPIFNKDTKFKIEIVEFNSFGAEFASGSALFHWLNDYDIMYNETTDLVVVRYVHD